MSWNLGIRPIHPNTPINTGKTEAVELEYEVLDVETLNLV